MFNGPPFTRREFLAAAAVITAGPWIPGPAHAADTSPVPLAIDGGPKSVPALPPQARRWGTPEQERLTAMLGQDTLFYWKGPQTTLLTQRFQRLTPLPHVMPCSSGTAALHIAVAAAGIAPGDEVITSPITDIGTVIGVLYQLGVPVFADLEPSSYNLDVKDVERRITPRTKAIIAVHLCGNPAALGPLRDLADRHGLSLIEDCAQAWGARYQGQPVGTVGHVACWSLQNSKQITCGDGGIAASKDPRIGPLLQRFGDKGFDRVQGGLFEALAPNYRMSEPQAAVAAAQLDRLEDIVDRRSALGTRLSRELSGIPGIRPHHVEPGNRCSFWFYMFRLDPAKFRCDRAQFVKALAAEGAPVSAGYIPVPLHRNPVFLKHAFFAGRWPVKELGLTRVDYSTHQTPEAEAILQTGIRVSIHESMEESHITAMAIAVRKVARHYSIG